MVVVVEEVDQFRREGMLWMDVGGEGGGVQGRPWSGLRGVSLEVHRAFISNVVR